LVFIVKGPVEEREVKQQKRDSVRLDPKNGGQRLALTHQSDVIFNTSILVLHDVMYQEEVLAVERGLHPCHQSVSNGLASDQRVQKPPSRSPQKV
jgi:hypothetical protein